MSLVFLDIDGVLVHLNHNPSGRMPYEDFDPKCIANLNRLCEMLGDVEIVIESDWLLTDDIDKVRGLLKNAGVKAPIIDGVPKRRDNSKAQQIWNWFDLNDPDFTNQFLIIDDDPVAKWCHWIKPHNMLQVEDGWENGGLCFSHIKPFSSTFIKALSCPECGGELVKRSKTGEGTKHCGDCGTGWYILKTSSGHR